MGILEKRQPSFITFRETFLNAVEQITGNMVEPSALWKEIGDEETREQVLEKVVDDLEKEYGFRTVIPNNLVDFDGGVEGVANQVHHNFNTMYLIEKINAKIMARRQY
ncbi:hypothetical protein [Desulfofalx alkaliphila]|uniref:hypothetical protein n=1 Tax=Desulfofalx alkaliphila TaxID=105483 RepID=UPI0004E1C7D4|nr:hypothetical protein [Desulfofalx alkaliphila]